MELFSVCITGQKEATHGAIKFYIHASQALAWEKYVCADICRVIQFSWLERKWFKLFTTGSVGHLNRSLYEKNVLSGFAAELSL